MVSGREAKIEMPDVDNNKSFSAVKDSLMEILTSENIAPKSKDQIRLIYSGRIIKDTDMVESIVNPEIQPPYTLQLMIRPEGSAPPSNNDKPTEHEHKCNCHIF